MPLIDMNTLMAPRYTDRTRECVTIIAGREHDCDPPLRIRIAPNSTTAHLQTRPAGAVAGTLWANVPGATVTQAQMGHFVTFLQHSFAVREHRSVLNNVHWRNFYHLANRALIYTTHANAANPQPAEPSVACYDCGLVLPTRNIQIDHQRPVEGNNTEAVCKVFRSVGLTREAGTGPKAAHFFAAHGGNIGGVAGVGGANRDDKYTLNNMGTIYFTIASWCGLVDAPHELDMACMNHIINLRPLCPACNTPNRNTPHYPVPVDEGEDEEMT